MRYVFAALFIVKMNFLYYIYYKGFKCGWESLLLTSIGCISIILLVSSLTYIYGQFNRLIIAFSQFRDRIF